MNKVKKVTSILLTAALLVTGVYLQPQQEAYAESENAASEQTGTEVQIPEMVPSVDEVPAGFMPIRTVDDLYGIRNDLSGNYILMNDIDLSEATAPGGAYDTGNGWVPIGDFNNPFEGILDGNGYYIKGLHMYGKIELRDIGLFGACEGVSILNLGLLDVDINISPTYMGYDRTGFGALAGRGRGNASNNLINCFITGKITVTDSSYAGNYLGTLSGSGFDIQNCYSTAQIECKHSNGEYDNTFCGIAAGSGIHMECTYNYGAVNNGQGYSVYCSFGYLVNVNNCYYLQDTGKGNEGCTPLTETQMQSPSFYTGFDFQNIWMIDELSSYPYPQLKSCPQVRVQSLEMKNVPTKLVYAQGEQLDLSGGVLSITYADGVVTSTALDSTMISGADMNKPGKQTVTVSYLNAASTFEIEVQEVEAAEITLSESSISLNRNANVQLSANIVPANTTDKSVSWESDNEVVVTVTKNGLVRGINAGSAIITATTANGLTASCMVTVKIPAKSIKLNKQKLTLKKGKKKTLKVTVNPLETTDTIQWSSSNTKIASVSQKGVVTAKKKGYATIMVKTSSGKKAYAKVTVK